MPDAQTDCYNLESETGQTANPGPVCLHSGMPVSHSCCFPYVLL